MDIKLKSSKYFSVIISVTLLLAMSLGVVACFPLMKVDKKEIVQNYFNSEEFTDVLSRSTYGLYWKAEQFWRQERLTPTQLYLPSVYQELKKKANPAEGFRTNEIEIVSDEGESASTEIAMERGYGVDEAYDSEYNSLEIQRVAERMDDIIKNWGDELRSGNEFYFAVLNDTTKQIYSNNKAMEAILNDKDKMTNKYQFWTEYKFSKLGVMQQSSYSNEEVFENMQEWEPAQDMLQELLNDMNNEYDFNMQIQFPDDIRIVYAMPKGIEENSFLSWQIRNEAMNHIQNKGFYFLFPFCMLLSAVLGFVACFYKKRAGMDSFIKKVPVELLLFGLCLVPNIIWGVEDLIYNSITGTHVQRLMEYSGMGKTMATVMTYAENVLVIFVIFAILYCACLSFGNIFTMGIKAYLKETSWTVRILLWIKRKTIDAFRTASEIDLSKPVTRTIVKLLALNFVVVSLLCCVWVLGIFGVLVYTCILAYFIRRFMDNTQKNFKVLLETVRRMAQGNLGLELNENAGIFQPIQEELKKVQLGFKKAVDLEVKSQNMKTELITNVSHDLKTPLTAIITYIDLLKNPEITEEERNSYIDTLDMKSQKLKRLIEDLFEVSKANSKNVTMHYDNLDLCALLKQVQFELSDKIEASTIHFRWSLPEQKIILRLDGQKTCRIIENLVLNITKYALPGTRAFVELTNSAEYVKLTFKNISAVEIDFSEEEITERFVRGDKSRNTEGSGLGLAIAKSFTELQGGSFRITVDGDLFKVELYWPKEEGTNMQK